VSGAAPAPRGEAFPPSSAHSFPPSLRGIRAAFVFLTRVPVGGFPYSAADWAWASAHFPLVGCVLGAALGALDLLLQPLGPLAAAILVLGVSMMLTGAFHEDGLADTADALGGATDRARVLEILKDSRIGAFGAAALTFSLLARAALLARLGALAPLSLPLAMCAARTAPVWLLPAMPYVSAPATAKSGPVTRTGIWQATVATAWLAGACALALHLGVASPVRLSALVAALVMTAALTGYRYARRLGGVTGDFLGATEQLAEIAALAALAWDH
jgi:adenosylcobinamide-GDP ribazoletransferase